MRLCWLFVAFLLSCFMKAVTSRCTQGVNCKLPSCFCPTTDHFLGSKNIPQIVYFAMDDDVSEDVAIFYRRLFHPSRKNPNGCPITGTLFASWKGTDYNLLESYYNQGFEIASHSNKFMDTQEKLLGGIFEEVQRLRNNTNIPLSDVNGWRSGYLKTAGDDQIETLKANGYKYDTSLTYIRRPAATGKNVFPMTTDYRWPYPCNIWPCYTKPHSNFWEVPINAMWDYKSVYPCSYTDGCHNRPETEEQAFNFFMNNFNNSYKGNRAPFGLHFHARYFKFDHIYRAMDRFIQTILKNPDVYIVPVSKMLDWMENPVTLNEIEAFGPWKCPNAPVIMPLLPPLPPPPEPPVNPDDCIQGDTCRLPNCFCKTLDHPTLSRPKIPQIVYFAFDDELDINTSSYLEKLFPTSRKNPNGCPVTFSLFLMDRDTDYNQVRKFYLRGNEIGSHSVDHPSIGTKAEVYRHAKLQRENLANNSGIPLNEIIGWRSPYLQTAGDDQADVLQNLGYEYDASYTYVRRPPTDSTVWPFTADYGWANLPCNIPPCLEKSHKGFWLVPINAFWNYVNMHICTYVDFCPRQPPTHQHVYRYLMNNFQNSYNGNRAPFGLHLHARWFRENRNLVGMEMFLKELSKKDDIYIVSVKKMLDWMKSPTELANINNFAPWQCTEEAKQLDPGVSGIPIPSTRGV